MQYATAARLLPFFAIATAHAAAPVVTINGGGAASQYFNYAAPDVNGAHVSEMPAFDGLQSIGTFGTYFSTTSGAAQTGLLNDDLSCISNAAQGLNGGKCNNTVGGANTVHYAVAESTLTTTQIANWATSSTGQSAAGNLIQIPMLGTGLAVVVNNPSVTSNGQLSLSSNDLCGIYSGKITNFNQLTGGKPLPASPLQVLYRADSAGTTFLLTNHLSAVCTTSNSNITFIATSTLASLFPGGAVPANFVGITGLSTLANTLAGLTPTQYPSAISYISPDWTSVDSATSTAKLSNGQPSPLLVAGLLNGTKSYTPTRANIVSGLAHPVLGQHLTPPTSAAAGANPTSWVPVIQTTSTGYPMVGYSTFDLAQCYADPNIKRAVLNFLTDHYHVTQFLTIQANNGLASPTNGAAAPFVKTIGNNLLRNNSRWNTDIGNATACASVTGR